MIWLAREQFRPADLLDAGHALTHDGHFALGLRGIPQRLGDDGLQLRLPGGNTLALIDDAVCDVWANGGTADQRHLLALPEHPLEQRVFQTGR